jgi:predicted PurR-regulated permease PerM
MDTDRSAARARAAAEWRALAERARTVTPRGLGRALLAAAVGVAGLRLAVDSWPALLPFLVGGLIAYEVLPVVDSLDRVMPRFLASTVAVGGAVLGLAALLVLVLPPLAVGFVQFGQGLPPPGQISSAIAAAEAQLAVPDEAKPIVGQVATSVTTVLRDLFAGATGGLDGIVRATITGLLSAIGAVFGLIVLPTWTLTLLAEKRRARAAVDARLPAGARPDFWSIVALADRSAGAYLRGYVVVAGVVAALAFAGAILSPKVGGPTFGQPLVLAAFAGASQLVPVIGGLLGFLPAILLAPIDPNRAGGYVALYLGARILGSRLAGSRLSGRAMGVPTLLLVPAVVTLSQFGVLPLLLSAPIVGFSSDLIRYVHGRLSEPPLPAGVLPRTAQRAALLRPRPASAVYTSGAAPRSMQPQRPEPAESVPA